MRRLEVSSLSVFARSLVASGSALAADDSNVKAATNQIKSGAKSSGEKVKDAAQAAAPQAKTAWSSAGDSAVGVRRKRQEFLPGSLQVTGDANGWVLRRMVKDGARGSS